MTLEEPGAHGADQPQGKARGHKKRSLGALTCFLAQATVQTLWGPHVVSSHALSRALCTDKATEAARVVLVSPSEPSSCPCQAHTNGMMSGVCVFLITWALLFLGGRSGLPPLTLVLVAGSTGDLCIWHPSLRHCQWDIQETLGHRPACLPLHTWVWWLGGCIPMCP